MGQRGISRGTAALVLAVLGTASSLPVAAAAVADTTKPTAMVLVLDASGSMNESDGHGSTKIASARAAVKTIIGQLPTDVRVGLMTYGDRVPSKPDHAKACADINLVAPVAPLDKTTLAAAVDGIAAKGETPIGTSLQKAADALPKDATGSVVLVSDGEDSCAPPAPCDVAEQLATSGVQLTVDTVGLKVGAKARGELTCISQATGGTYTDVQDTAQLAGKLGAVTQKAARAKRAAGGSAVEGTPSLFDAPTLVDGKYTDSVVMGEALHWKVDLAPGQAVTASVAVDASGAVGKSAGGNQFAGGFTVKFLNEQGNEIDNGREWNMEGRTKVKGVGIKAEETNSGTTSAYLQVALEEWKPGTELPISITIKGAASAPAASDSASASASASASDGASPSPGAADGSAPATRTPAAATPSGSSGYSLVVLLAAAGGALLVGLGGGFVLGRRTAGGGNGARRTHDGPTVPVHGQPGPPPVPAYPAPPTPPAPPRPPVPPRSPAPPVPPAPYGRPGPQGQPTLPPPPPYR